MITHLQEGQLDRNFQARVWHRIFRSQNVQLWKFSSLEWFGNDQLLLLCISGRFSQRCFHVNPLIYGQQLPYDKFGHQAVPHLGLPEAWQREWHIQKPPSIASYIAHQEIVTTCWNATNIIVAVDDCQTSWFHDQGCLERTHFRGPFRIFPR